MRNWNRAQGVLFVFATAVYLASAVSAVGAAPASGGDSPATADPFASTTQPVEQKTAPVALPKITASDGGTFSIQINNDVPLVEVLRMIGSQSQVSIIPSKEVRGTVPAMDLYNVTVNEALDAILTSNGFGYVQKGNIIYVFSDKEISDRKRKELETDVYRLYYISAADAEALIKTHLSSEGIITVTPPAETTISGGGSEGGGGTSSGSSSSSGGSSSTGGSSSSGGGDTYANVDMLVITDHPDYQEKIAKIVKEIDCRPKQVLVEATILEVTLNETNSLGVNFTALGSINFSDLGVLPIGGAPGILTQNAAAGTTLVTGPQASAGFNAIQTGAGGLQLGIVQDNIAVFLNALESVTNTTVLSNPKVLTVDKQEGKIHIGTTIYYQGSATQTGTSNTSTVSSLDTGITLDFRAYVGDDGYIRLQVDPSDSTPVGGATTTAQGLLPPNINANEVSSNVMVKDGRTVVIGGLFEDNSSFKKGQVPFFGNLPGAGPLFGQQNDSTTRSEIIFLLTPHIVKDEESFSGLSEAALRDAERLRVGTRQGMMPWGRERLAETSYELAEKELHKPHPDLNIVRWHLDSATNLNPLFLEAIKLRETVTGEVLTTSDNSSIRTFIRRLMLDDKARGVLLEQAPPKIVRIVAAKSTTQPSGK